MVRRQVEVSVREAALLQHLAIDAAFSLHDELEKVVVGTTCEHEFACEQFK